MVVRLVGFVVVGLAMASSTTSTSTSSSERARDAGTNIFPRDYVGPAACGECHLDEAARWSGGLHRVMNARASDPGAVTGDFSGATISYAGGEARFARDGDAYTMTLARGGREVRYRVTRTIGRRGLQEYVGTTGAGDEVRLPFGWWHGAWYPQPAFDPWLDEASFDPYRPVTEPWAERCPWCHSTYPFAQRIARASGPRRTGHGLEQFFASAPGGDRLGEQVTTGISCESCHLGGRDHARGAPIHFVPRGAERRPHAALPPSTARFADERRDPTVVNAVCAQCHSGPSPRLADGTALRNSSEALDLGRAPCDGITCLDCHDPHTGGHDDTRAIAACVRCHDRFAEPAAARRHAGHDQVSCLDCHMPRVVMGIDRYVRTHRISSPGKVEPNACNLCHLDRPLAWTADARHAAAPDSDEPAGHVWLASDSPAIRLIATAAYAQSPLGRAELPRLRAGLADPRAYVRAWTTFAVEALSR